jgi:hypothetical protein
MFWNTFRGDLCKPEEVDYLGEKYHKCNLDSVLIVTDKAACDLQ